MVARRRARVTVFDAEQGWGEVESVEGERYPFHCTAVADGTRRISVGAEVVVLVEPGRMGRVEATLVDPIS